MTNLVAVARTPTDQAEESTVKVIVADYLADVSRPSSNRCAHSSNLAPGWERERQMWP
jgi:hypothetical protein